MRLSVLTDLKSLDPGSCGFESRHPHQKYVFYNVLIPTVYHVLIELARILPLYICVRDIVLRRIVRLDHTTKSQNLNLPSQMKRNYPSLGNIDLIYLVSLAGL